MATTTRKDDIFKLIEWNDTSVEQSSLLAWNHV